MEFALSENNERISATRHVKGFCTICKEPMIPKCGRIKSHHWAHKSKKNCDPWWEPESEWHRQWKNLVNKEFREIVIEKDGKKHRADIKLLSGIIVELQKSPLSYDERLDREAFYENMLWVIHFQRGRIEVVDKKFKKDLFDDYYVKVKNFNEWIYRSPHPSPIFLDFDDGEMFLITEFDNYVLGKTRWIFGNFISKKEFIKLLRPTFFDFDLDKIKISHLHSDDAKKERQLKDEKERKRKEAWQKKQEDLQKIHEEKSRKAQEEFMKGQEDLKIIHDADKNYKWGFWTGEDIRASSLREKLEQQSKNQRDEFK